MSVAIDIGTEEDRTEYEAAFDDNHTVRERKASTCTWGGMPCLTCE